MKAGLRTVGYRGTLLRTDYTYADVLAARPLTRTVLLAAFAQDPPSYVNACFGVISADGDAKQTVRQCTALGAPQIIVVYPGRVDRWSVAPGRDPQHLQCIVASDIARLFAQKKAEWSPEVVFRAKAPLPEARPRQLDFVDAGFLPAIEREAQAKLHDLIVNLVRDARGMLETTGPMEEVPEAELFHLLFALIRAKVLKDRGILPALDFSAPENALAAVDRYYRRDVSRLRRVLNAPDVLRLAAERVASSFLFHNLSVETLGYVYENTLVTAEHRRRLGVHGTPSYVADYILSKLPIEEIPCGNRKILDPTCGSGTFLVAALRRLRGLLPARMPAAERHAYYTSHLRGMEIDPLSREVAYLALLHADLPNPDGWDIQQADSFLPAQLEQAASQASILVANPPFESFTPEERQRYDAQTPMKGGEMLRRVLPALPEGALLGVVMPRKFADGHSYTTARRELASRFDIMELTALPDRIFPKSDAQTVLVMARKLREGGRPSHHVVFREVKEADRNAFATRYQVTREEAVPPEYFTSRAAANAPTFWIPVLHSVWDVLSGAPRLGDFARVHRGVEYEAGLMKEKRQQIVRTVPFDGGVPGVADVAGQLRPYAISDARFLETRAPYRRRQALGAWDLPWDEPKVVANAKRSTRGPWRLVAAVDRDGLLCADALFGMWPRDRRAPLELLAAVLNGPVANAFVHDHEPERDNRKDTMLRVPFPSYWETVAATITDLVNHCVEALVDGRDADAVEAAVAVDAEVLAAYALPPREERCLLDTFWGERRPGMASFPGYIPPDFTAWIPLRMYLSESFQRSTAEGIRRRGARVTDLEVIRFLDELSARRG